MTNTFPYGRTITSADLPEMLKHFSRNTIGSDALFRALEVSTGTTNYPPYNLEKISEDEYRLTFAVAGFTKDELKVQLSDGSLVIKGEKGPTSVEPEERFIHRGLAFRDFERSFRLMEHIVVKEDGISLENGLLTINLLREVPEALKPKTFDIK